MTWDSISLKKFFFNEGTKPDPRLSDGDETIILYKELKKLKF